MRKKYIIIIGILVIILAIAGVVFWNAAKSHSTTNMNKKAVSHMQHLPKEVTVTLTKNGFSPKTVTIKVGSAVRWVNKSGKPETVNSDNYPTNQLHRELNFGEFANNSSVVYTFTKPGTYGYHNQFHHTQDGKIIVIK
jgi:plastocyanin